MNGLGSINYLVGNKTISLQYYRAASEIKTDNIQARINPYRQLARFFKDENNIDSCIYYAKKGYNMISSTPYLQPIIQLSEILKDAYKRLNSDSALKYTNIYYAATDSMYGRKKIEQIQALNFDEEIRQQKIEEEKLKALEQRKHNLQYAGIALGLITFIILFLLFSHSIIANEKLIRFLGVLALLIVFEFINLFIHPYLFRATNGSPAIMLLVMVCIAALLIPLHHRLEKLITNRLVEKNKKIRLAAAKKTIAKLEGEQIISSDPSQRNIST